MGLFNCDRFSLVYTETQPPIIALTLGVRERSNAPRRPAEHEGYRHETFAISPPEAFPKFHFSMSFRVVPMNSGIVA